MSAKLFEKGGREADRIQDAFERARDADKQGEKAVPGEVEYSPEEIERKQANVPADEHELGGEREFDPRELEGE